MLDRLDSDGVCWLLGCEARGAASEALARALSRGSRVAGSGAGDDIGTEAPGGGERNGHEVDGVRGG